jgi:hypothetical protein
MFFQEPFSYLRDAIDAENLQLQFIDETDHGRIVGMAPSDLTFTAFLSKQMDSKEAAMELLGEFSASIDRTDHTIYRFRSDMSSPHEE